MHTPRSITSLVLLIGICLSFTVFTGCSPAQWQNGLNTAYNIIEKDLPIAQQFAATEHDAGNLSDAQYAAFNGIVAQIKINDLPLFQAGIAAVTNSKGAVALI